MRDIEYKVIRFLIFIGILFLNYHILLLFTSFIAPEGFLNDVKRIGGFSRLNYDKFPLNRYNGKLIFTYKNKEVVLIDENSITL